MRLQQQSIEVKSSDGKPILASAIFGGNFALCAILISGDRSLRCWSGMYQQKHDASPLKYGPGPIDKPISFSNGTKLPTPKSVVVGSDYACALLFDGRVYCFGQTSLEKESFKFFVNPEPVKFASPSSKVLLARSICGGSRFMCAILLDDDSVYCWGSGSNGELNGVRQAPYRNLPIFEEPLMFSIRDNSSLFVLENYYSTSDPFAIKIVPFVIIVMLLLVIVIQHKRNRGNHAHSM
jgi:alpha-tubulin suppressor-like RCC1 family protein